MKKTDLQNYANIVENNIEKDLKVITSIVYNYDVKKIIEGTNTLSSDEQDKVLEMCINKCLTEIQSSSLNQEKYKKVERDADEIIDFYEDNDLEEMMEEASTVTYDLIMKVIGHNSRKLELPVNIDFIKTFCIHNMVKEDDVHTTVLFILLELSSVCYCLKHNDYNKEDE